MIKFIDTSRWEDDPATTDTINWQKAKDNGAVAVIMKATEGTFWKDPVFLLHKRMSKGILYQGSFHYYRPKCNKKDQAKYYYDFAGNLDLPPVLDLEDHYKELPKGTELEGDTLAMLYYIDEMFNQECILYTSPNIIKYYLQLKPSSQLLKRKLWVAHYTNGTPYYYPWDNWTWWQYSETGKAENYGIEEGEAVDENYYNGTIEQFIEEFGLNKDSVSSDNTDTNEEIIVSEGLKYTLTRSMNIRSGAGLQYPVIGVAPAGTEVSVKDVGGQNCWIKVDDISWICKSVNGITYLEKRE